MRRNSPEPTCHPSSQALPLGLPKLLQFSEASFCPRHPLFERCECSPLHSPCIVVNRSWCFLWTRNALRWTPFCNDFVRVLLGNPGHSKNYTLRAGKGSCLWPRPPIIASTLRNAWRLRSASPILSTEPGSLKWLRTFSE